MSHQLQIYRENELLPEGRALAIKADVCNLSVQKNVPEHRSGGVLNSLVDLISELLMVVVIIAGIFLGNPFGWRKSIPPLTIPPQENLPDYPESSKNRGKLSIEELLLKKVDENLAKKRKEESLIDL